MSGLGTDEDQGGDPVGRRNGQFERARASDRAADDNQTIALGQLESFGRPSFDRVSERVERWRICRARKKLSLPSPHRAIKRKRVQEEQFQLVSHAAPASDSRVWRLSLLASTD